MRAALYAIVQKPTQCSETYRYDYSKMQSKAITATKVGENAVNAIIKSYWENAYDHSCRVPLHYYVEPYQCKY